MSDQLLRDLFDRALRYIGLSDKPAEYDSDIHRWSCKYPDIYGECECFEDAIDDILDELKPYTRKMYAIRMPDGEIIEDPEWDSIGDVMRSSHGQGVKFMPGTLLVRTENIIVVRGEWEEA